MKFEKDEKQIRELWAGACEDICKGDWESYSKYWSHNTNIQLIHPDEGEWLIGWDKIGAKYREMLKPGFTCTILRNELILNISALADMAWGTVDIEIDFNITVGTKLHLWETIIFEKIDGQWKMVHGMASIPEKNK